MKSKTFTLLILAVISVSVLEGNTPLATPDDSFNLQSEICNLKSSVCDCPLELTYVRVYDDDGVLWEYVYCGDMLVEKHKVG